MRDGNSFLRLIALALITVVPNVMAQSIAPDAQVHVDADSGDWRPTAAQSAAAADAAAKFMTALSVGQYEDAFKLFTPETRRRTEEKTFEADRVQWTKRQGPAKSLVFTDLNWSRNPKTASRPGVYVAIGFSGHYAQIERYCGYMVLSQPPSGGPFLINHVEETALDNKTASQILKDKGQAYLDQSWKTLKQRCPGADAAESVPGNIAEVDASQSDLSFDSVADARAKLKARTGTSFSRGADGWDTFAEEASHTVWSFAPDGYFAYPAMIERRLIQDGTGGSIKMSVLCEADQDACDRMVKEASAVNRANAAQMRSESGKPAASSQ